MRIKRDTGYCFSQHPDSAMIATTAITGKFELIRTIQNHATASISSQPHPLKHYCIIKKAHLALITGPPARMAGNLFCAHTILPVPDKRCKK